MEVAQFFADCQALVGAADWDRYEQAGIEAASEIAGDPLARAIATIDLDGYTNDVERLIREALIKADELRPAAMYFEYDLTNGWESAVFHCRSFEPSFVPFGQWPTDFATFTEGPGLTDFAERFAVTGWSSAAASRATVIATAARTIAVVGRVVTQVGDGGRPWGIGFHGQSPVVELVNPTRRPVDLAALRGGLDALGTPAASAAVRELPEAGVDASMCVAGRLRWSWKFKHCLRRHWRTIGGAELMTSLPDEVRLVAVGWQSGSRRIIALGDSAESPTHCVVFESDPDAPAMDPSDDLDVLAGPAEDAYRAALRRRGLEPRS